MATEKEIKNELLNQLEKGLPETDKRKEYTAEEIILKHKNQLKRLKRIAVIGWMITAAGILAICNLQAYLPDNSYYGYLTKGEFWFRRFSDIIAIVLVISAFLISYLVYHKSKTLTMLQICARLASIEQHLKNITQNK